MEIYFDLKEVTDDEIESTPKGVYLSIKTSINQSNKPVLIPYREYEEIYTRGKLASVSDTSNPGVAKEVTSVLIPKQKNPDFTELVNFLNTKIGINQTNVIADDKGHKKIKIQSTRPELLELPWEEHIDEGLFIVREVACSTIVYDKKTRNNFLILVSRAHEGNGDNIQESIKNEMKLVYETLHDNAQNNFWVDNITISRHTSPESIIDLPWDDVNFAHLIMHGESDGSLCLEDFNPDMFKTTNRFSIERFLELIEDNCLSLIFLSMCYSGGGTDKESLAFQIVKSGYSKYVIGYSHPVGEDSATEFSNFFYKNLAILKEDIECIYIRSLESYYSSGRKRYIPLLYSSV